MWLWVTRHKPPWRRSPLVPPQSRRADDPQTAEQLYQRNSQTVKKVLGPTIVFPTWGSSEGTENPQGIWLWRPVGFDYRTSTGLGKQMLGRHKQNLVCTRTQEKGVASPQKTEPDLPVSGQESPAEAWVFSGLLQGRGTENNSSSLGPFEEDHHYCHYSYHSLASGQTTGKEHSPFNQQKI